ncbi:MAG TPA: signal peptidase II [Solirubrobacteraceae bacterium]|jgi:signal peptidase II
MRQGALSWAKAALVAILVFALDWVSKRGVESSIVEGEERRFLPGIELVHTRNRGVAFGLFAGAGDLVTVAIAVAVIALLIYFVRRSRSRWIWLPAGMLIGGALGNVVDRLRHGAVTDFIKLPLGWPPFNLADASITIGVLIFALLASQPTGGQDGGQDK